MLASLFLKQGRQVGIIQKMEPIVEVFVRRAKWLNAEGARDDKCASLLEFAGQMRLTPRQVLALLNEAKRLDMPPSIMIRKVVAGCLNS